jgi:hypothetical protein
MIIFCKIIPNSCLIILFYLFTAQSFFDNNELYIGVYGFGGSLGGFFELVVNRDCMKRVD